MTTEPPFLDRYVYLDDKPDRPIPDGRISSKTNDLRAQLIQREEVYHGTSIDSLFILLLLGAMASVVLRELAIHGPDPTIPMAGVWGLIVGLAVFGAVVSLLVAIVGDYQPFSVCCERLPASWWIVRRSPRDLSCRFAVEDHALTTLGSLMLIVFAILFARWRIQSQLSLDSSENEIEKSLEEA